MDQMQEGFPQKDRSYPLLKEVAMCQGHNHDKAGEPVKNDEDPSSAVTIMTTQSAMHTGTQNFHQVS